MASVSNVARRLRANDLLHDSPLAARAAHVRYIAGVEGGFRRVRAGRRFRYLDERDRPVTEAAHVARIASLAIPPAWESVWICRTADGHIQATGVDARGRKQYRYHSAWRALREQAKYSEVIEFGRALPQLRQRIERDLRRRRLTRDKVLAALLALMQKTSIRVGNDEYASSNGSYGLTTLLTRHAQVQGARLSFKFRGKSGKAHRISLVDRRLAGIVLQCRMLPGARLFQYLNERGQRRVVTSSEVNRYLREATGRRFSAKEFRTWEGTLRAALHLAQSEPVASRAAARRAMRAAAEVASAQLGNTATICQKSYVHPAIFEAYRSGSLQRDIGAHLVRAKRRSVPGLSSEEAALLAWFSALSGASFLAKCA